VHGFIVKRWASIPPSATRWAYLIHRRSAGLVPRRVPLPLEPQPYAGAGYAVVEVDSTARPATARRSRRHIRPLGRLAARGPAERGSRALGPKPWMTAPGRRLGASYRRLHDQLDRRNWPDRFRCLVLTTAFSTSASCPMRQKSCGSRSGSWAGRTSRTPTPRALDPIRFVDRWKTPTLVVPAGSTSASDDPGARRLHACSAAHPQPLPLLPRTRTTSC